MQLPGLTGATAARLQLRSGQALAGTPGPRDPSRKLQPTSTVTVTTARHSPDMPEAAWPMSITAYETFTI